MYPETVMEMPGTLTTQLYIQDKSKEHEEFFTNESSEIKNRKRKRNSK